MRRARRLPQKRGDVIAEAHGRGHALVSPAVGCTRRTRLPGLARRMALLRLSRLPALGTCGRLDPPGPFAASRGRAGPALPQPRGSAMLAEVTLACLARAPIQSRGTAVAIALGASLWFARLLMRAVAPTVAVASIGAPRQASARKAAAPALAAHGDVVCARRFADPGDGRAQHFL